ncbi:MAG TPA: TIGR03621 family F420-dependent LLM class oxidoreductase [Acidimicrobiia bacterium]|nr:TIGR03621 family F420-dependent LLM class oxidoreductase [Acidimicrobiia bacterium]
MKPFRFGVQVSTAGSATEWRDKARKIEDLGYSTLFMPDHFGQELAPLPAIAMAAAHTTTLRVGSLVFDNDYKHPAILAKEATTIDLLSDGRLELGLGAGWMRTDYDQLGLPYDPPAVRVDRFEEALHVIKECFTGEQFTYHGEHYRITDYAAWPKPVQQPGPPILIGGGGKRVLSIAARHADIVGINPNLRAGEIGLEAAKDSLRQQTELKVEWIRDAAGTRIDDIEIQMRFFITSVRPDRMKLAEALAPTFGVSPEEAIESGAALVGTEEEIAEQLHRRREEWGLSYVVVGDENVDEFAPIVAKLAGT